MVEFDLGLRSRGNLKNFLIKKYGRNSLLYMVSEIIIRITERIEMFISLKEYL